ncbi:MAG: hypothetical protein LBM67_07180 [Lentimicrobiaceae bacterium]|jgi:hypothetical protein|nr:hypothetical protein [Lentimicrobiaceae bacterium]
MKFLFTSQPDQMDCGSACLAMIATKLQEMRPATHSGVSMLVISDAAKKQGFKSSRNTHLQLFIIFVPRRSYL